MSIIPNADFHEIWWIYSPVVGKEWAGLRIAHFRKTVNGVMFCIIQGEADRSRIGMRIWDDIRRTEQWFKVAQIKVPTTAQVMAASLTDIDG